MKQNGDLLRYIARAFKTGEQVDCENLRAGCAALSANDGYRGQYSYIKIDTTKDGG